MDIGFDKQGHRGCRGLLPENTIPAMLKAIDLGVTTLEMDIVFTRDEQAILSHEPFFNHEITTRPDGLPVSIDEEKSLNIFKMTYEEVKTYDVGLKVHPRFTRQVKIKAVKPRLEGLIDSVHDYCRQKQIPIPFFNIETKITASTDNIYHPAPERFVELLMEVIFKKNIREKVIIQSFDKRTLQYLHTHYPEIPTALLIEGSDDRTLKQHLDSLGFIPVIYSPEYTLVDNKLISECHKQNIKIIPWTVNDSPTISALKKLGVDGIITDYPDLF